MIRSDRVSTARKEGRGARKREAGISRPHSARGILPRPTPPSDGPDRPEPRRPARPGRLAGPSDRSAADRARLRVLEGSPPPVLRPDPTRSGQETRVERKTAMAPLQVPRAPRRTDDGRPLAFPSPALTHNPG